VKILQKVLGGATFLTHTVGYIDQWMPYNFVADSIHTETFFQWSALSTENGHFAFWSPPTPFLWGLGATYAVHPRLIEKRVVDLLLVIIELFSLGVMAEALQGNIDW